MSKRRNGNGQTQEAFRSDTPLDVQLVKAEAAEVRLRELIAEANGSVKDSRDAGERMVKAVVEEFESQGVGVLVNHRVEAYLNARNNEIQTVYNECLAAIKTRERSLRQQTARANEALEILEQWVARLFLLSSSKKFQTIAQGVLGDAAKEPDPFKTLREQTYAFLDQGTQRRFEFPVPAGESAIVLHLDQPTRD